MEIKELVRLAHENAVQKGFWDDVNVADEDGIQVAFNEDLEVTSDENNAISTRLMLIVGELSEAQEGLRKDDRDNFKEELADVAIRLGDLCGGLGIDLEAEIIKKMDKNKNRPYKHGKAF